MKVSIIIGILCILFLVGCSDPYLKEMFMDGNITCEGESMFIDNGFSKYLFTDVSCNPKYIGKIVRMEGYITLKTCEKKDVQCKREIIIKKTLGIYDTTCEKDSDCKSGCPLGCINKNEDYISPKDVDCGFVCVCKDNVCVRG